MKKNILVAVCLLLAIATASSAANVAETFSISPMIGGISFEGKQHLETNPVYGLRLGYNFTKELGVEALFDYAHTEPTLTGGNVDFYRYGGELLYHFLPDNKFVPYIAAGYAAASFNGSVPLSNSNFTRGAFDYGLGAKFFLTDKIALRGDIRHLVYHFDGTQQAIEYMAGLYIPFGGAKPVVKAIESAQAPMPVVVPALVVAPQPAVPAANLTISKPSITKGEPATLTWTSQNASACDIQPNIGKVQPQGSLALTPLDSTTYTLTCNGEGGTAKKSANIIVQKPVPVVVVPPAEVPVAKLCSPTVINIQFDTNKSAIKPQFHGELKKLADFLIEFPEAKGEIEGHTDNVGAKEANIKLSQHRAESVRNYLVKTFGIAPERISAKGYGPAKPVADNKTKEGKLQNRRVEANFTCGNQ